jgi:hypothetical protein
MPSYGEGVLDEFTRANENPLGISDGNWTATDPNNRPPLQLASNSATQTVAGDPNYSHWTRQTFDSSTGEAQIWACTDGGQLGAALETWRVALWLVVGGSVSGYLAYYGGGIGKGFALRRYDGGIASFTGIGGSGGGYPTGLGIGINGGNVECWASYGDPFNPTTWALQCSATDGAYRGKFYGGIAIEDPTSGAPGSLSFGCFGGGVPTRTQFFRWLHPRT